MGCYEKRSTNYAHKLCTYRITRPNSKDHHITQSSPIDVYSRILYMQQIIIFRPSAALIYALQLKDMIQNSSTKYETSNRCAQKTWHRLSTTTSQLLSHIIILQLLCVYYYLLTSLSSALAISLLKNGVSARLVEARVIDEGHVVVNAITAGAEMASVNAVENFIVFIYLFISIPDNIINEYSLQYIYCVQIGYQG